MGKKKDITTLFELITRQRDKLDKPKDPDKFVVPGWMDGDETARRGVSEDARDKAAGPQTPSAPETAEADESPDESPEPSKADLPKPAPTHIPATRPAHREFTDVDEPAAALSDQQGIPFAFKVAGGILVVMLAFFIGRSTVSVGPGTPKPTANQPNQNIHQAAPPTNTSISGPIARIPGKHYLVIESLRGHSDADYREAEQIVDFCDHHGHPAEVTEFELTDGGRCWGIWSLKPFDNPNSSRARAYAKAIEELGQKYFKLHRTYRFQQRTHPGGEFQPLFLTHHPEPSS
ncbi:hypothetical protein LCGC14_0203930 [marine sediment metagenome]|uniref:Uncharacterized protein n=1 Tax=marine sediment metagenome TaxID=412755 RepID=A0A0F9UI14_9ZZZZ|nr:hypothetical protein [Phycisphaerae bacterium]HDZ43464.1 hypothetical protein [Phycisphaerae bacterium]